MSIYDDGKIDKNDLKYLDTLKNNISNAYAKGELNEKHYENLKDQISVSYEEIFKKMLELLEPSNKNNKVKLKDLESDIVDAYSKRKINDLHYNLLKEKISSKNKDEINK